MTKPNVTADTRAQVSPKVYTRGFGDELVLLDFAVGEYFGLDAIGAEIWRRLEGQEPLHQIADGIVQQWRVSRDQALRDTIQLVEQLVERSLVTLIE